MSRRNFTLLIIILFIAVTTIVGFLYFRPETTAPTNDNVGTNFFSQFNPFGTSATTPPVVTPPADVSGYEPGPGEEITKLKLTKVSSMPIAGYTVFIKERLKDVNPSLTLPLSGEGDTTSSPPAKGGTGGLKPTAPPTEFASAVRYVEKAMGYIYQTFADKMEERKFSGTVVPKVYDSYFGNRGESVIMRYLKTDDKTIETFVGALPKEYLGADTAVVNEIKGSFLPNNIRDISLSPDGLKIFYLFDFNNSLIGTTLDLSSNKKVQIFDSPFTEWLSWWGNNNMITLSTKPSANVPGYMYSIDGTGKNLTKILGNINGLTTLGSPDGKLVLYADNNLSLYLYHIDSRNSDLLGIRTLPEKCVWGNGGAVIYCAAPKSINAGGYPDAWYQGEISFDDQIWKIDPESGNTTLVSDPSLTITEEIDGIKLTLNKDENYLFFINKKDSFLWKLDLK